MAWCGSVSLAAMAMYLPQSAFAQESTAQSTEKSGSGLGEIIVTARRTAESMQSVPVAVTALSGSFLDSQNIVDVTSVPQFTPNLSIMAQPGSPTAASVFIRGIGNQLPSAAAEQGVGIYIDGVYVARAAGALFDLVDLERIEVLRGPQGTLFGRNTVGGAVQLVSRKPQNEMGVQVKAGYGRYNDWSVKARVDTGYIGGSNIKASIAGMHRQRDGYVDNLLQPDSRDPGSLNGDALMINVQGDFGDLTANYAFDYNDRRSNSGYFQMIAATPLNQAYFSQSEALGGDPFIISPTRLGTGYENGFVDTSGNLRYRSKARIFGHSLTLEYRASDAFTLKSISAYREFKQDTILGLDGQGNLLGKVIDFSSPTLVSVQPVALYNGNNADQDQWQFSQEFQALGDMGDISYVAGVYYFKEKAGENLFQLITLPIPVPYLTLYGYDQKTADTIAAQNPGLDTVGLNLTPRRPFQARAESMAAFGQVTWRATDRLELTGGLRYTHDKKSLVQGVTPTSASSGKVSYNNVSWMASANYNLDDDVMVYLRASSGYRSGGFVAGSGALAPSFRPEKVKAFEVGLKSEFFDHRLRINLAAFYTDYKDLQISQFAPSTGGVTTIVVNAASATLKGIEAEVTAIPVDGLTFDGSLGYTHDNFKNYDYRDPATDEIINIADEVRLPQAPKFNAHVGAQYEMPVGSMTLTTRADYSYRSTVYFHNLDRAAPFNRNIRSRPDHNLRARISLSDIEIGSGRLEVGVWGNNLTNDKNIDFGIDFGSLGWAAASFKQPRTYGVDAKVTF
ncbi:TonB-dependent receptor [Croceicoccus estronivorus]|nr:TonB-dependent receptor [Croceicoccus estronivorus]